MTYKDLLNKLQNLSEKQLEQFVTIQIIGNYNDECFYPKDEFKIRKSDGRILIWIDNVD